LRILLIEDDPSYGALATVLLESLGHAVQHARAVTEGVRLAQQHPPDLIFADMHVRDMTGYDAIRLLRADERTRGIPVLAMTASRVENDDGERERAEAAGFQAYLEKPVNAEGFRGPIGQVLDRAALEL
jgi:two-component system cell cycle response regulator DivK